MSRIVKGFTLIELLVVISIIALLLSILLPALGVTREQARSLVCSSNLKTLVMAAQLWAENNDGWTPPASWSWGDPYGEDPEHNFKGHSNPGSLEPYTSTDRDKKKNVYACPSAKNVVFFNRTGKPVPDDQEKRFTYGSNAWITIVGDQLRRSPGDRGEIGYDVTYWFYGPKNVYFSTHGSTKLSSIRQPQDTIMFMDHELEIVAAWNFNPKKDPVTLPTQCRTRWHRRKAKNNVYPWYGSANIGWVDGHVSKEPERFEEDWRYYLFDH